MTCLLEVIIPQIIFLSYDCAQKKTSLKCRAKAYVSVTVSLPEEEGGPVPPPVYRLERVHTPEFHNHTPDNTRNIARSIIGKMMEEITKNPCLKIGMC